MERFSSPIKRENFFFPAYKIPHNTFAFLSLALSLSLFRFWLEGKKKKKDEIIILN